jgi:Nup133 N terminal like
MATSNIPTSQNAATAVAVALRKYWSNDFTPLQAVGGMVNAALRADEEDVHSDLYRCIISGNASSPQPQSHLYFPTAATAATAAAAAAAAATTTNSLEDTAPQAEQVLKHRRSVPLPSLLTEKLSTVKRHSSMGLLPGADLAYLSVDDKLYLWSYQTTATTASTPNSSSVCSFTVTSGQCVIAVGLVRPKKGTVVSLLHVCCVRVIASPSS